jgi:hypothetical protein
MSGGEFGLSGTAAEIKAHRRFDAAYFGVQSNAIVGEPVAAGVAVARLDRLINRPTTIKYSHNRIGHRRAHPTRRVVTQRGTAGRYYC